MVPETGDYRPIDCGLHSEYELAIMRGQWLRLQWTDPEGRTCNERLLPLDLRVWDGAEYLLARDAGGRDHAIRLDRIRAHAPA
ncbi:MAG TPA: transcriptional antiterminator, Rof [Gammaproteobacteria bacterium]|nr:transcriptional antiterminator, Rof [Gammaproteobacteria bacterium]